MQLSRIISTNGSVSTYTGTVNDIFPTFIGLTQDSFGNIIVSTLDRILKIKNVFYTAVKVTSTIAHYSAVKVTSTIARISKNANSIQASANVMVGNAALERVYVDCVGAAYSRR
jgi:hypothetical protein